MTYRTYRKIKAKGRAIRRVLFIVISSVFLAGLFAVALAAVQHNATAAAAECTPEASEPALIAAERFEPLECSLPDELQEYTYYICQSYGVEFELAMAVMYTESGYDPEALSSTGDYGLMQINGINAPELEEKLYIKDITDPYQNIRAGVYILSDFTARYSEPERVLMSYNMGEYGAAALWDEGIHSTTYTDKVLAKYREYTEAAR